MRWIQHRSPAEGEQWDLLLLQLLWEIEGNSESGDVGSAWIEPKDLWAAIDRAHTQARELLAAGWAARAAELGLLEHQEPTSMKYRNARTRRSAWERARRMRTSPELLLLMAFRSAEAAARVDARWTWVTPQELHAPLQAVARGALDVAVEGWEHDAEQRGLIEFADRSPLFRLTDNGRFVVR